LFIYQRGYFDSPHANHPPYLDVSASWTRDSFISYSVSPLLLLLLSPSHRHHESHNTSLTRILSHGHITTTRTSTSNSNLSCGFDPFYKVSRTGLSTTSPSISTLLNPCVSIPARSISLDLRRATLLFEIASQTKERDVLTLPSHSTCARYSTSTIRTTDIITLRKK